jgi:hypothetical protein
MDGEGKERAWKAGHEVDTARSRSIDACLVKGLWKGGQKAAEMATLGRLQVRGRNISQAGRLGDNLC